MMTEGSDVKLPKWPFYLGDVLLIFTALMILFMQRGDLTSWSIVWIIVSVALGALLFTLPFIFEFKGQLKLAGHKALQNNTDDEQYLQLQRTLDDEGHIRQQLDQQSSMLTNHASFITSLESQVQELQDLNIKCDENGDKLVAFKPEEEDDDVEIGFELEDEDCIFELGDDDDETSGNTVTVIANITMGIGSKPFIRGTGGGINWEEGFPMEFIEVGKWQWTSIKTEEPVTYRIYKNDAVAANEESQTIQPGETQEIHPHFGPGQEKDYIKLQ